MIQEMPLQMFWANISILLSITIVNRGIIPARVKLLPQPGFEQTKRLPSPLARESLFFRPRGIEIGMEALEAIDSMASRCEVG